MSGLIIKSPAFEQDGLIPEEYTGYGADSSPELRLDGIDGRAVSMAVILDDLEHPVKGYNHWLIWNIPVMSVIPSGIPPGETVASLSGAVQGRGYGKYRYRGPKPPFNWSHRYRFTVFTLDCLLDLPSSSRKKDLLRSAQGHVLQQGELFGHYK